MSQGADEIRARNEEAKSCPDCYMQPLRKRVQGGRVLEWEVWEHCEEHGGRPEWLRGV